MKTLALLIGMAVAAGPAVAQQVMPAPAPAHASPSGLEQRIAQMHQRLKITPAQETAWDAFAQVMRTNAKSIDDAYQARATSIATMSAPDNMRNFAQIEATRAQDVQTLATSFQTLYDTFSDEQKKAADTMFRHVGDKARRAEK
jgi:hypothetical protein